MHRDVRLRALRDAPDSFGEIAAEVELRPQSYWESFTQSVTQPGRHVMFLACEGNTIYGSIYGTRDRENAGAGRVGGTWVEPAHRRQGIGKKLLQAVISWARAERLSHLRLWAPAASHAALALYRQAGFNATGTLRPLPTNAALQILELECELSAQ